MDRENVLRIFVELRSCLIRDGSDIAMLLERPDGADRVLKYLGDAERIIRRLQPIETKGKDSSPGIIGLHDVSSALGPRRREFCVSQDEIVRTGHGKKVGVYEQRLPKERFEKIWESLGHMPRGREFSPQDLAAKSRVPSYQVYIALEVLSSRAQLLDSPRRGAYRIASYDTLALDIEDVWNRIAAAQEPGN